MNDDLQRQWEKLDQRLGFYLGRIILAPLIPPEHLYFSLTNRCNLQCVMCDVVKNPSAKETELTTAKVKDIVSQAKQMNIGHIIFSGGEPFLREDLCDLIEFSTNQNIPMVDIISNGALINDEAIKKLIKAKLNHITISLDGLKDVNDSIRGRGSFEKAKSSIDKINYYKSKENVAFPTVGINFTVMDRNINDMIPMIEFARQKKCNIIVFQPVLCNNTKMYEKENSSLWPKKDRLQGLRDNIRQVVALKRELNDIYIYTDDVILNSMPDYFEGRRPKLKFKCYEGIKRIVVTCDGKLWSCVGFYGDLNTQRLEDAWFSESALKIRESARKCRLHCLQDCIYFPEDVRDEMYAFAKKLKCLTTTQKDGIRSDIERSIMFYIEALLKNKEKKHRNFLRNMVISRNMDFLRKFKKEVCLW